MTQLVQTISKVKKYINQDIKIDGMLLTLVDNRTNLAKDVYKRQGDTLCAPSRVVSLPRPCVSWRRYMVKSVSYTHLQAVAYLHRP